MLSKRNRFAQDHGSFGDKHVPSYAPTKELNVYHNPWENGQSHQLKPDDNGQSTADHKINCTYFGIMTVSGTASTDITSLTDSSKEEEDIAHPH